MSARTLADALAECRAAGVDLRVSGRGLDACMVRLAPFCPNGVTSDGAEGLPACAGPGPSAAKAAILFREAQARMCSAGHEPSCLALGLVRVEARGPWGVASVAGTPWGLVAVGGAVAVGLLALATR